METEKKKKKVLVLGASLKSDRISHEAVERLSASGHQVIAYGMQEGMIGSVPVIKDFKPVEGVDTITLYLNSLNQKAFYDFILNTNPKRVIFNPGTENPELQQMLTAAGIYFEESCTLVMLRTSVF